MNFSWATLNSVAHSFLRNPIGADTCQPQLQQGIGCKIGMVVKNAKYRVYQIIVMQRWRSDVQKKKVD